MDWLTVLIAGLANIAGTVAPAVGTYLTNEQEIKAQQLALEQQRIQAQLMAQQQQIAAEKAKTTMLVVGGVAVFGLVAFMVFKR